MPFVYVYCLLKTNFSFFSNYKIRMYHCIENIEKHRRKKLKLPKFSPPKVKHCLGSGVFPSFFQAGECIYFTWRRACNTCIYLNGEISLAVQNLKCQTK